MALLTDVCSSWEVYGARDMYMEASLQHKTNSLQSTPLRLGKYYSCFIPGRNNYLERLSLSTVREGAYRTRNSLTLGKIYWWDQHHCANYEMQIERTSSTPGQHATLYKRDKLLSSDCVFPHSTWSFHLPYNGPLCPLQLTIYNSSMTRITDGLGVNSPSTSAHNIHCQTLRTLVKYVLQSEISGPSKLQHRNTAGCQSVGQFCKSTEPFPFIIVPSKGFKPPDLNPLT